MPQTRERSALSMVGVSYRGALGSWLDGGPPGVECVEILAEHFSRAGRGLLHRLRERYPLSIHTERLSPGSPGPQDAEELAALVALVRELRPLCVSDHLGFRCTQEIDLGSPVPLALDDRALERVAERVSRVMDACQVPVLLENLASPLEVDGSLAEPEFLNRLCERCGCGVLLDVTALAVNARNRGFDALRWLHELDPGHIVQVHVGGCREREGRWTDAHDGPVHDDAWALLRAVLGRGSVQAIVLERDASFPPISELARDLARIRTLVSHGGPVGPDAQAA